MNIIIFGQNCFERGALQGERYVKLLLIVATMIIWFPKGW